MKKLKTRFPFLFLFLIILLTILGTIFEFKSVFLDSLDLKKIAENIFNECKNDSSKSSCYEKKIPDLMKKPLNFNMQQAFKVTAFIQELDPDYTYCHVLGHELSGLQTKKDPSKWKEIIASCPTGVCSNGCIHGTFQERYRYSYFDDNQLEKIKPELTTICLPRYGWDPSDLEKAHCYHAMGHLLMYITRANPLRASSLCRELTNNVVSNYYTQMCLFGVFMQLYQPLGQEDQDLIAGKSPQKDTVTKFCSQFTEDANAACSIESWPLFFSEIHSPSGLLGFCKKAPSRYFVNCLNSLFYIMPVQFKLDSEKSQNYCRQFSAEYSGRCLALYSQRLIQTDFKNIDKAVAFCNSNVNYDPEERCYYLLAHNSSFNFKKDSSLKRYLCNQLPEKWKTICQNN